MAYAIIQAGGKQFRVTKGEVLRVPSITGDVGSSVRFDALARGDSNGVSIGTPVLEDAQVTATIVEHGRGPKLIVFKKKRRKQYKKKHGHRQNFTAIRIESIGAGFEEPEETVAEVAEETAVAEETVEAATEAEESSEEVEAAATDETEETVEAAAETEETADDAEAVEADEAEEEADKKE